MIVFDVQTPKIIVRNANMPKIISYDEYVRSMKPVEVPQFGMMPNKRTAKKRKRSRRKGRKGKDSISTESGDSEDSATDMPAAVSGYTNDCMAWNKIDEPRRNERWTNFKRILKFKRIASELKGWGNNYEHAEDENTFERQLCSNDTRFQKANEESIWDKSEESKQTQEDDTYSSNAKHRKLTYGGITSVDVENPLLRRFYEIKQISSCETFKGKLKDKKSVHVGTNTVVSGNKEIFSSHFWELTRNEEGVTQTLKNTKSVSTSTLTEAEKKRMLLWNKQEETRKHEEWKTAKRKLRQKKFEHTLMDTEIYEVTDESMDLSKGEEMSKTDMSRRKMKHKKSKDINTKKVQEVQSHKDETMKNEEERVSKRKRKQKKDSTGTDIESATCEETNENISLSNYEKLRKVAHQEKPKQNKNPNPETTKDAKTLEDTNENPFITRNEESKKPKEKPKPKKYYWPGTNIELKPTVISNTNTARNEESKKLESAGPPETKPNPKPSTSPIACFEIPDKPKEAKKTYEELRKIAEEKARQKLKKRRSLFAEFKATEEPSDTANPSISEDLKKYDDAEMLRRKMRHKRQDKARKEQGLSVDKDAGQLHGDTRNKQVEEESVRKRKSESSKTDHGIIKKSEKNVLNNFKEKDGGKVVVYTTTMGILRDTYQSCTRVKQILRQLLVKYEERDVFMSNEYQAEIKERMHCQDILVPQVFVDGQHIGDAETIERLNETGELRRILKPFKSLLKQVRSGPCVPKEGSKSVHFDL